MKWILLAISTLISTHKRSVATTLSPITSSLPSKCDDMSGNQDWYLYNGHCYTFSSQDDEKTESWDKSVELCRDIGAELTSVRSSEENAFIESMVSQNTDGAFWIGGRQIAGSGFQWVDGQSFDFENWASGEPSHSFGQEDCIEIHNLDNATWNDANCGHTNGRICKRLYGNTIAPNTPTTTIPEGNCPDGWTHVVATGRCFFAVNETLAYASVRTACTYLDARAQLVSLHHPKEMAYIRTMIGNLERDPWIGLTRESEDFVWSDQTTVDYTPWAPGQPDGLVPYNNDCIELQRPSGLMDDVKCTLWQTYICALDQDPAITKPNTLPKCDTPYENYTRYKDDCYRPVKHPKTWQDAEAFCKADGAHLGSAYGIDESSFMWILAQDPEIVDPWIGLNKIRSRTTFDWSDGWPVSYTNWGEEQPTDNATRNCVRLNSTDGMWYDGLCDEERPFICRHSEDKAPTAPSDTGHCRNKTWTDIPGGYCYNFFQESVSWSDANSGCVLLGSQLVSIHSDAESALLNHTLRFYAADAWIGLIKTEAGLGWTDGSAYDYTNWADDKPRPNEEKCTQVRHEDGVWNDFPCDLKLPYICKEAKVSDPKSTDLPTSTSRTTSTVTPTPSATDPVTTDLLSTDLFTPITTVAPGSGLSGGAIFGIVIGCLGVVTIIGSTSFILIQNRRERLGFPRTSLYRSGGRKNEVPMDFDYTTGNKSNA